MPRPDEFLLGAVDAGTTGVRFALIDQRGRPVDSAYREVPIETPRPGWVEQDPDLYLGKTLEVIREVLARRPPGPPIAAVGITNQRETVVCWDRETGRPLHPAVVWQDRRTAARCRELQRGAMARTIRERTGLTLDPYFSATRMEWLLNHVPDLRAKAESGRARLGTVDSWLAWHLTARHATDDSNASRTMLFDLRRRRWDDELLSLFGIPPACLPEIVPSMSIVGPATKDPLAAEGIPVAGMLGDQQAALLGQGIAEAGPAQVTWGTGAFLLTLLRGEPVVSRHGLLTTVARTSGDGSVAYALEGSVFTCGAALQWLREGLGLGFEAADSEGMARSVESTAGVVFVPALSGLGAPHWDPRARGLLVGMTRGTRREHVVRAALEAIAYQTHDVLRAMEQDAGSPFSELRVGGGVAANDFLCAFQSDILGIPVVRPRITETTVLGAAFAAGISLGLWKNAGALPPPPDGERRFDPTMPESLRTRLLDRWNRAVERAGNWDVPETNPAGPA